ncbi:hypothetical protein GCM10017778_72290 [Streptomyces vinaceus]|nr:hypothetical protein GCM10017778_72290 [Streptomyces vinaceus]
MVDDVWAAWRTDQMQRAMEALFDRNPDAADLSARDRHLADSLLNLPDRSAPDTRLVLVAYNAHIQRRSIPRARPLPRVPMGHVLARRLGQDYVSTAMTSGGGTIVQNVPDPAHLPGMRQSATDAPAPVPASVEATDDCRVGPAGATPADVGTTWRPVERSPQGDQRGPVPGPDGRTLAGPSRAFGSWKTV